MPAGLDPVTIAQMATSGIKALGGVAQIFAGKSILKKTKLPEYNISPEFGQNVLAAQAVKTMGMPTEQYNRGMSDIGRNMNFAIKTLGDRRNSIAGIGTMFTRANDAVNNLNIADANMRNRNMIAGTQMEIGAKHQLALQKLAKQEWEKFNPYMRKMQQGQALLGSGLQNTFGALGDTAQMFMLKSMNSNSDSGTTTK